MQTLEDEHGQGKKREQTASTKPPDLKKMSVGSVCRRRVRRGLSNKGTTFCRKWSPTENATLSRRPARLRPLL